MNDYSSRVMVQISSAYAFDHQPRIERIDKWEGQ